MNTDRRKRENAKEQIAFHLQAERMQAGDRIPSERKLCDVLGVSRITVRSALSELIKEGILSRNDKNVAIVGKLPETSAPIHSASKQRKLVFTYFPSQPNLSLKEIAIFSKVYHGIERYVHACGDIIYSQAGANFLSMNETEKATVSGIMATGALTIKGRLKILRSLNVPLVLVNWPHSDPGLNSVSTDFYEAGQKAVLSRKSSSNRRILFLSVRFNNENVIQPPLLEIWYGALTAASEYGIEISRLHVEIDESDWLPKAVAAVKRTARNKGITEIIAGSGQLHPLLRKIREDNSFHGVSLSIVDSGWVEKADDGIEVLRLDMETCGLSAARRLYDLMSDPAQRAMRILAPEIIDFYITIITHPAAGEIMIVN